MTTYLVSRGDMPPAEAEQAFGEALGSMGELRGGTSSIRSVWILDSRLKAGSIRKRLSMHLEDDEQLLVSELSENWRERGLDEQVRGWLRRHLFSCPV